MGAFIRSKNVLLAELSEGAFIRRGALIRRNTVHVFCEHVKFLQFACYLVCDFLLFIQLYSTNIQFF